MTAENLYGFIGSIRGNEGNLVAMDAVSGSENGYIRYPAGENVPPRTLAPHELGYVHRLDNPAAVRWQKGQAIWFAGRNLVARASANSEVRSFAVDWHATQQGHRLIGGTPAALRRMRDSCSERLSTLFRRYVLDNDEVQMGEARATWELLQAFDNIASPRRSLNAALFAKDVERSLNLFDAARLRAVRSGAFPTVEEFDAELAKLRTWLADPPLSRREKGHATLGSATELQRKYLTLFLQKSSTASPRGWDWAEFAKDIVGHEPLQGIATPDLLEHLKKAKTSAS